MNALECSFTIMKPLKSPTPAPTARVTRIPTAAVAALSGAG